MITPLLGTIAILLFLINACTPVSDPPTEPGPADPEMLTLSVVVNGQGSVRSNVGGIDCPGVCEVQLEEDTVVSLLPTPEEGYFHTEWQGCPSGANNGEPCRFTLTRDTTVQADFIPIPMPDPDPTDPSPTDPDPSDPNPTDPNAKVTLHFIDVGQGDAVLIQGTGGQTVLYDGGRADDDTLPYLQALGITKLDVVIASHPDADHIGGLDAVIEFYQPQFFMDNGVVATTNTYQDLLEAVQAAGSQLLEPTRRTISLGDATLEIIPPPNVESFSRNDNSIGVVVDFGAFEAALTGDAEEEEFDWWLENTPEYLKQVEVYKSSHHGSKNGDTLESILTWQPETVVISVGASNPYGHPSPEALALYTSVDAVICRTDLNGSVVVTGSKDGSYATMPERGGCAKADEDPAPDPDPDSDPTPEPPEPDPNEAPQASFTLTPSNGSAPLVVKVDASGSSDTDGTIQSYAWDFGDAQSGTGRVVEHRYSATGTYPVTLTVTDDDGATDTAQTTLTVSSAPQAGRAEVVCVLYNPVGQDDGNEYVRTKALGPVNFSGWFVEDEKEHRFALPSVTADQGDLITVRNTGGAKWNNDGDTAYLYDPSGTLIDSHRYSGGGEGVCE